METFKRHQVEGALAECLEQTQGRGHEPKASLIIQLKRLLETDRLMPTSSQRPRAALPDYAFFDGPPPGRGTEVTYSAYAVFALYVGLRIMRAGIPQSEAVWFMRRIRGELKAEHGNILAQRAEDLLDHSSNFGLQRDIKLGLLVRKLGNMVFLVVPAEINAATPLMRREGAGNFSFANICRSVKELNGLLEHLAIYGPPIIAIELVNPIHRLAYWLGQIEPVKRGRKA